MLKHTSALGCLIVLLAHVARAEEFTLEQNEQDVAVLLDGKPFTVYRTATGPKPILWPIIGSHGQQMTRSYPMEQVEGEKQDHPHQRSFFFTHGDVNGVDFWSEIAGHGSIVHQEYVTLQGGMPAVITTKNEWRGPDGKPVMADERTLRFATWQGGRTIDFDITLKADFGHVTFGDTKEGTFGVRIPTVMDVDSNQRGQIVNQAGLKDAEAWGKQSPWVDYHGTVEGHACGIAILNHPSSFRHPTYWHVRTYGLFAANPFGLHDFLGNDQVNGSYTLPAGESLRLRYRVYFHEGDEQTGQVEAAYQAFAAEK